MEFATTQRPADIRTGALELTMWMAPRMAGPPVHVHPAAEETFTVTEGTIEVLLEGRWNRLGPGETAVVPIGAPHSVRNSSTAPAVVVNTHRPALGIEAFFEDGAALAAAGKITALPPKGPKSAIYAAMLFTKHAADIVAVGPQRPLFRVLTVLGRALSWKV